MFYEAERRTMGPLHRAAHPRAIEATVITAPTVAMKRGDRRVHSYKIDSERNRLQHFNVLRRHLLQSP